MTEDMLAQQTLAVIGVSANKSKYGWIVFDWLRQRGVTVYAVNPNRRDVAGYPCYATVADLPQTPDVVVTVVPPRATRDVVHQALARGVTRFWMQPGSEDDEAIAEIEAACAQVVHHDCIMMH